jgi:hypothetical protein
MELIRKEIENVSFMIFSPKDMKGMLYSIMNRVDKEILYTARVSGCLKSRFSVSAIKFSMQVQFVRDDFVHEQTE